MCLKQRTVSRLLQCISMAIYEDRVEIENPGHLPSALTPETMKLPHDSYPANVDIADVLFKTKFLDSWGSGVKRMVDACNEAGLPEPEYKLTPGGVAVVFKRPSAVGDTQNDTPNGADDTQNDTLKKVDDTQKRDTRLARIAELIADDNTISTAVIAGMLGISVITVKRDLKILGYSWQGHPKTGHWVKEA